MNSTMTFNKSSLEIEMRECNDSVYLMWIGKSVERIPGEFINPIFFRALDISGEKNKIIMDFQNVDYMNSSTISHISKILEYIKNSSKSMSIIYRKTRKWQELCFSALQIYASKDRRINFIGKK